MQIQQAGIGGLGPTELLVILGLLVFLFGAKKLPEIARGSGRALRIFKSETKGLMDDDEATTPSSTSGQIPGGSTSATRTTDTTSTTETTTGTDLPPTHTESGHRRAGGTA